jgi:hypothetical protein
MAKEEVGRMQSWLWGKGKLVNNKWWEGDTGGREMEGNSSDVT